MDFDFAAWLDLLAGKRRGVGRDGQKKACEYEDR
jgi:hypothetical protein